jgi:hypothetical protein
MELHERLKKAREHAKFETVTEAAEALGVPYPTYAGHENGTSGFRRDSATLYARRFGVSLDWLLAEKGPMTGAAQDAREAEYLALFRAASEPLRASVLTILRENSSKQPKP